MRIGATMLSLMVLVGLSLAAQTAAVSAPSAGGAFSSLLLPSEHVLAPGSSLEKDPPGDTLHVDYEAFNNAVGLTAGGVFYTAARLTPTRACTVVTVIFYKWDVSNNDYVFVWGSGTPTNPGPLIESVPYTGSTTMAWQSISLPIPVPLEPGEDIWVGPRMNHTAGTFPLGVDDGPAVAGRGGWINYQGSWIELSSVGLQVNWHIRAIVGSGGTVAHDVGVEQVLAPTGSMPPGTVAPKARVRNFGTNPESSIPVLCWIDSAGTRVFTDSTTHPGPLAPGAAADVTFPRNWTGVAGRTYQVTMFTKLAADERRSNDTARATVTVMAAVWESIPKPPSEVDRLVHATVYDPVRDKIFMIGGNPAGQPATYLNLCQQYDPAARSWSNRATMPTARGWLAGSYCKDKVYIIGGHDNAGAAIAVNECYDPVANTWSAKAPRPRVGLAAMEVVWNDTLVYVMGGNNLSSGMNNVDIYDPTSNTWAVGTPLPLASFMGSAAIIGDTIFVVQAYSGSACWPNLYKGVIDASNPTQIAWTAGPAPTEPTFNGGTAALDGEVYWLGGFINAATVTNHVWKYSTSTGAITRFTPDYPATLARCNYMVSRPRNHELYVIAGDEGGNWTAPNQRYFRIALGQQSVEEPRVRVESSIDNVTPTLSRGRVNISFTVARQGNVNLAVYDASGALVRTLLNGTVEPGTRTATWDRTNANGRRVSQGSYFYRLTVDGRTVSSKSVLFN
ncbi:hypothetical protein FJY70_02660 [candidate division WOR-3 bacterium]|nr:hypothetical protein [candidate division WOR-3 bacterium]